MNNPKDNDDYKDFLDSKGLHPSEKLTSSIFKIIHEDLNPNKKIVLIKLLIIQAFIGLLTLLFCPQFNMSLTNNFELFHYFHHNYGEKVCMVICGSIFMGTGAIFASSILNLSEVKLIRSNEILLYPALSIFTLSIFFAFGAELFLGLTIFWLLGASLSSIIFFEISFRFRSSFNF